ncbi:T9SS type A sorting domain-containing protein [Flavobacterium sp. 81]|uniref:T9SS type A sorting domain-containing protein n=1 Tax=Flavobacterium sp. 81 TaxID=2135621 RepID=UPI001F2CFB4F|nr:T9SS type A sorting domain-containing protein [Flavobacterium sp. 81]
MPTNKTEVKIELYNFGGQLISGKTYTIENGKALLNLENQASGIYAVKVYLETPEYLKIIKK